jgi:small subunit ribosomal protein S20
MANHKSSEKAIRKIEKRTDRNRARRSRIKTFIQKVEDAISSGDKNVAQEALRVAQPEMARGAGKGVFDKNTISRKISRLSKRIKSLAS